MPPERPLQQWDELLRSVELVRRRSGASAQQTTPPAVIRFGKS